MSRNTKFFYLLIVVSIFVALFISILLGLIVLIGDIFFYFYLGRSARRRGQQSGAGGYSNIGQPEALGVETNSQPVTAQTHCKYCNALLDPTRDRSCPSCGAPVET
jgi:hypothetical protein